MGGSKRELKAELEAARKRIEELETDLMVLKRDAVDLQRMILRARDAVAIAEARINGIINL